MSRLGFVSTAAHTAACAGCGVGAAQGISVHCLQLHCLLQHVSHRMHSRGYAARTSASVRLADKSLLCTIFSLPPPRIKHRLP